jgi:hypothetical protein
MLAYCSGSKQTWHSAAAAHSGLRQDPVDHRVQQLLELLGGALGDGPFDVAPDSGQEVACGHRRGGVAFRFRCRRTRLQPAHLAVKLGFGVASSVESWRLVVVIR